MGSAPGDVAALAQALVREPDARVRDALFTSLARSATREGLDAILAQLRSDDANIRTGALDALRSIPQVVAPRMPDLLADPDPDVRLLACEIVRGIPQAQAVDLLCDLLDRESQANVCASAIEVLAEVGSADAIPALERCAARFAAEPFLGFSARMAVERLGPPSSDRVD
jgi:HEAT repeat protein